MEEELRPVPTRATPAAAVPRAPVRGPRSAHLNLTAYGGSNAGRNAAALTVFALFPRRLMGGASTLRLGPETDVALPPLIASRARAPDFSLRRNYIPARGRCQRPAEWRPRGGWGLDGSRPPRTCASRDRWQVLRRSFSSPRHRGPQGLLSAEMPLFYKAFSTRFSSSCFS